MNPCPPACLVGRGPVGGGVAIKRYFEYECGQNWACSGASAQVCVCVWYEMVWHSIGLRLAGLAGLRKIQPQRTFFGHCPLQTFLFVLFFLPGSVSS